MEENKITNEPQEREIDLIDLFRVMINGIKKFFNWIFFLFKKLVFVLILLIRFVAQNILWALVGIAIALVVVVVVVVVVRGNNNHFTPYYSSEMSINSNCISNQYIVSMVNQLGDLLKSESGVNSFTNKLGISTEEASLIKSIKAGCGIDTDGDGIYNIVDYDNNFHPSKDTLRTRVNKIFFVNVEFYDNSILPKLQYGLTKFICSNEYIAAENRSRIDKVQRSIADIDREIEKLDSLQHVLYFETPKLKSTMPADRLVFMNEIDQKLYHQEILSLKSRKTYLENDIKVNPEAITIVLPLQETEIAQGGKKYNAIKYSIYNAIVFLILGAIWKQRKKIWEFCFNKSASDEMLKNLRKTLLNDTKE